MNYLIVGASSGLGRDIAYTFAKNLHNLTLLSRDSRDLAPLKSDLENKFNVKISINEVDASSLSDVDKFLKDNISNLNTLDGVLFPIGMMSNSDTINFNDETSEKINNANYLSIVHIIENLMPIFETKKEISIVGFGSMASALGRKENIIYSASKRALNSYFESLSVSVNKKSINIQFYILGYLDTNLAFDKNLLLPKSSTKQIALKVFKNINKKNLRKYYPIWWGIINYLINIIPFVILKKIVKFIK